QVEALQLHIVQPDRQARRELDIPEIRIAGDRRALDHAAITRRTYRPRTRLVKLCTRQLEDGSLDLEAQRARCSDDLPVLVDPGLDGRAGDLLVETPDGNGVVDGRHERACLRLVAHAVDDDERVDCGN